MPRRDVQVDLVDQSQFEELGLVPINQWALTGHIDATTGALVSYSAIARKP